MHKPRYLIRCPIWETSTHTLCKSRVESLSRYATAVHGSHQASGKATARATGRNEVLTPTHSRTTRKPEASSCLPGALLKRPAERAGLGRLYQEPPRKTRSSLPLVANGSVVTPLRFEYAFLSYMSSHHSHTFPIMSFKPNAFAANEPTGAVNLWPSSNDATGMLSGYPGIRFVL